MNKGVGAFAFLPTRFIVAQTLHEGPPKTMVTRFGQSYSKHVGARPQGTPHHVRGCKGPGEHDTIGVILITGIMFRMNTLYSIWR
jgi:hypothetical protein